MQILFIVSCFWLMTLFSVASHATDLVNVDWLKQHQNAKNQVIIDLRKAQDYSLGHIPNSINLPYEKLVRTKGVVDGYVTTPIEFKTVMEQFGIKNSQQVVLYSDWSFLESMRAYWVFDFFGHKNIKVLDGGFQAWEDRDFALTQNKFTLPPSQYVVQIRPEILSTKFKTFMATKSKKHIIIDARDMEQYLGKKSLTKRKGHIPEAVNLPWFDLVQGRGEGDEYEHLSSSNTLLDMEKLEASFAGVPKDKKIILYCNGGQESSVLYFALKELGRDSAVYDGSWFEWSEDAKMPVTLSN